MKKKPNILGKKIVAQSRLFQIEQVRLAFSNGQERYFERFKGRSRDSVMLVPLLDDETILLVREYAVGIEDYHLSLPTGAVDEGETYLEAANRELKEEVGYGANQLTELKSLSTGPAYSTRKMRMILATDLYPARLEGDEPEPIEVVPWSIKNIPELIEHAEFHDAKTLAALYLVREFFSA